MPMNAPLFLPIAQSLSAHQVQDKPCQCQVLRCCSAAANCTFASRSWLLQYRLPLPAGSTVLYDHVCSPAQHSGASASLYCFQTLRSGLLPKSHHPSVILVRHEYEPLLSLSSSKHLCNYRRHTRQLHVPKLVPYTDLDRGFGFPA
jgi:hypothetical protein